MGLPVLLVHTERELFSYSLPHKKTPKPPETPHCSQSTPNVLLAARVSVKVYIHSQHLRNERPRGWLQARSFLGSPTLESRRLHHLGVSLLLANAFMPSQEQAWSQSLSRFCECSGVASTCQLCNRQAFWQKREKQTAGYIYIYTTGWWVMKGFYSVRDIYFISLKSCRQACRLHQITTHRLDGISALHVTKPVKAEYSPETWADVCM